jgi:hypothetical protein
VSASASFTDAPTVFTFTQPPDAAVLRTGSVIVKGTAPAPAKVGVSVDGGAPSFVAPAAGGWSLALALGDGAHALTATQSGVSFTHNIVVDTTSPTFVCDAPDTAWHGANVSLACTATDTGSRLRNPAADGAFSLSTNVGPGTTNANASTGSNLVCDVAGNCVTVGPFHGMKVDRQKPAIDCHGAVSDGLWHTGDVSFACDVSDDGSGVAQITANAATSVPAGSETASAVASTGDVCDAVGNCGSHEIAGNKIDRADPVVICNPPSSTPWYGGRLDISCNATDLGAGISTADDAFSLTASTPEGTETTAASTPSHTVTDGVGHSVTVGPFGPFMLDNNAPATTIHCGSGACNGGHFYRPGTRISFPGNDAGSGYSGAWYTTDGTNPGAGSGTFLAAGSSFAVDASMTIAWRGVDNAGNLEGAASNPPTQNVEIDGTPPEIAFLSRTPANANGWNNSAVRVVWTCVDSESGVADGFVSTVVSTEGQGLSATGTCTDNAGNTVSDTQSGISIDTTAPTIAFGGKSPAANANGWNSTAVNFSWTCSDPRGSGVVAPSDSLLLVNNGASRPATGNCTDLADNHASDTQYASIDQAAPVTTFVGRTPAANARGWNNGPVTMTWSCVDYESRVVAASVSVTLSGEGVHQSATGVCTDLAGNQNPDTRDSVNIDLHAPVLAAVPGVSVNATGPNGANVTYTAPAASDNLDPSPTVACVPASGGLFAIGDTNAVCTATDAAGNVSAPMVVHVHVKGAAEQIADLGAKVGGYVGLSATQQEQLRGFMVNALNAYNLGMPAHKAMVCTAIGLFDAAAKGLGAAGRLPLATAQDWVADGTRIRLVLAC